MTQPIRAVLVGCGGMSRAWLGAAAKIPSLAVVGLVDIREEAARQQQEKYGLQPAVVGTDLKAVLDKVRPEVVFDCTVPEAHHPVVMTALAHGCHVLGEKPLADSLAHAREMVAAAQRAGKIYAVTQNYRYQSPIRRVRRFVEAGTIGPVTTVNCDFYLGVHFGGFRDRLRHVLLLDMAIHTFDAARFITGTNPAAVYCKEWNPPGSWYDHDASAVAIFEMSDGSVFTYRGSWCAEGLNTSWNSSWRIIGTHGSATWDGGDGFRGEIVVPGAGFSREKQPVAWPEPVAADKTEGHTSLLREFVECVQTGAMPETVCTDNIKSLAMVFGAIESAETGRRVEIRL